MSAASNFTENLALNWLLTATTANRPTSRFVALFRNTSGQAAANLEAGVLTDEISGGSYARESVSFTTATSGSSSNSNVITFPAATANWGTITHIAIVDALTGGNVLFWGAVTTPKTIETGDTFQILQNNLTITLA